MNSRSASRPCGALRPLVHALSVAALLACAAPNAAAQGMKDLKRGPWDPKDAPPSWVVHTSKHYQIQSHAGAEKAERLAEHMETMLTVYKRLFPRGRAFKRFAVKLFGDHREFLAYGAPPGAGAYYSPVDREVVCYDTGKWMDEPLTETSAGEGDDLESMVRQMQARSTMDILGAAAHEGWHQFFHWYVTSWIELPSWINEGMGDYFYAAKPLEQSGRHGFACFHMQGMLLQNFRHLEPVLIELTGQFDKITGDRCSGNERIGHIGEHAMKRMAEFVKERARVVIGQQRL